MSEEITYDEEVQRLKKLTDNHPSPVTMLHPRLNFRCGDKEISLRRRPGGEVEFVLIGHGNFEFKLYKQISIKTADDFETLWEFLGGPRATKEEKDLQ